MRRLIPVLWLAGCLVAPASAWADVEQTVSATGGVTVTWRGDPARGCAEQAACDLAGSLLLDPSRDQGTSGSDGDHIPEIGLDLEPVIARVVRGPASDPAGVCVDTVGVSALALHSPEPGGDGTVTVTPSAGFGEPTLSSGRCAGPTRSDLAQVFAPLRVPASAFRRARQRLDLRGQRTFGAGPYTVEAESTLVLDVRRRWTRGDDDDRIRPRDVTRDRERVRWRRRASLSVTYAVEPSPESMALSFSGLIGRGCEILDACGVSGATTVRLARGESGRLVINATGPASLARGRRAGPALAALAAGRMRVEYSDGYGALRGRVDAEVRRDGAATTCRDGADLDAMPQLDMTVTRTTGRLAIGGENEGGHAMLLRTRCPGPTARESGPIATGSFPSRALADPVLSVPLGLVAEDPWPFATAPAATSTLKLRRMSARVRTQRVPVR